MSKTRNPACAVSPELARRIRCAEFEMKDERDLTYWLMAATNTMTKVLANAYEEANLPVDDEEEE